MSYMQLSEGVFQVVCSLGLWSRVSGVSSNLGIKSYIDMASKLLTFTLTFTSGDTCRPPPGGPIIMRNWWSAMVCHLLVQVYRLKCWAGPGSGRWAAW